MIYEEIYACDGRILEASECVRSYIFNNGRFFAVLILCVRDTPPLPEDFTRNDGRLKDVRTFKDLNFVDSGEYPFTSDSQISHSHLTSLEKVRWYLRAITPRLNAVGMCTEPPF